MSVPAMLASARREPGQFAVAIPDGWMQGRTAYGGLSSALAYEAARTANADLPPLRAAQIAFIGPVAGLVEARATVERRGRNASWVRTELRCSGQLCHAATFLFMRPLESRVAVDELPVPANLVPLAQAEPFVDDQVSAFVRNLECRHALPRADRRGGDICCWARLRDRAGLDPFTELVLIGDGLPPAALSRMPRDGAVSSLIWQMTLLDSAPRTEDGWWLLRSTTDHARAGCAAESMHIWNAAGHPVQTGGQAIALFG